MRDGSGAIYSSSGSSQDQRIGREGGRGKDDRIWMDGFGNVKFERTNE